MLDVSNMFASEFITSAGDQTSDGSAYDSDNDSEREEVELALYAQIHHDVDQANTENVEEWLNTSNNIDKLYTIDVQRDKSIFTDKGRNSPLNNLSSGCDVKVHFDEQYSKDGGKTFTVENGKEIESRDTEQDLKVIDVQQDVMERNRGVSICSMESIESVLGSDCMLLDETMSEGEGDLHIHVNKDQQHLLKGEEDEIDEEAWEIVHEDRCRGLALPKRYYRSLDIRCHNCDEIGHLSKHCTKPKKETACILCGKTGHHFKSCPDSCCFNCDGPGHSAWECPNPRRRLNDICYRCSMCGHQQVKCPDGWRQFHMTTTVGILKSVKKKKRKKSFCYNCGGDDHFGHECDEERIDNYSRPTYPFIVRYEKGVFREIEKNLKSRKHKFFESENEEEEEIPRKRRKLDESVLSEKTKPVSVFVSIAEDKKDKVKGKFSKGQDRNSLKDFTVRTVNSGREEDLPRSNSRKRNKRNDTDISTDSNKGRVHLNNSSFKGSNKTFSQKKVDRTNNVVRNSVDLNFKSSQDKRSPERPETSKKCRVEVVLDAVDGPEPWNYKQDKQEDYCDSEKNHQVFNNEWWKKTKKKRKKTKKEKKDCYEKSGSKGRGKGSHSKSFSSGSHGHQGSHSKSFSSGSRGHLGSHARSFSSGSHSYQAACRDRTVQSARGFNLRISVDN